MKHTKTIWWISGPKWTFTIVEENGIVIEAAPISRWAVGHPIAKVMTWWKKKGAEKIKTLSQ